MIFSLLKVRKKTAAVLAGVVIAATCLWGLSMWQDISARELAGLAFGSLIMVAIIAALALLLIASLKLLAYLFRKLTGQEETADDSGQG